MWKDSLYKIWSDIVCLGRPYHFKFLKAVSHRFHLVHSGIPWPTCRYCETCLLIYSELLCSKNVSQLWLKSLENVLKYETSNWNHQEYDEELSRIRLLVACSCQVYGVFVPKGTHILKFYASYGFWFSPKNEIFSVNLRLRGWNFILKWVSLWLNVK